MARVWVSWLLLVLLPAGRAECLDTVTFEDPRGDVTLLSQDIPPNDVAPTAIDAVSTRMTLLNGTIHYVAEFVDPPEFGSPTMTYRYWLGFNVEGPDGVEEYMDVRVMSTTTYDTGHLVSSNEKGNQLVATLPVQWDGPSVSFQFPLRLLDDLYGGQVAFGDPQVQADGRSLTSHAQGFPTGAVFVEYMFVYGLVTTLCEGEALPAVAEGPPAATKDAPAASSPLGIAMALLAALVARRQAY